MEMRELTLDEIERVSGAGTIGDYAADGGAIGSIIGTLATNTMAGAARGGVAGALIGASWGVGQVTGNALHEWLS